MGEYRHGKWVPTFGDDQFGVSGGDPVCLNCAELRERIAELEADVAEIQLNCAELRERIAELEADTAEQEAELERVKGEG
jgi:multidrug resistance efflux pump